MIRLLCFVLTVLALPFKSKFARLQAQRRSGRTGQAAAAPKQPISPLRLELAPGRRSRPAADRLAGTSGDALSLLRDDQELLSKSRRESDRASDPLNLFNARFANSGQQAPRPRQVAIGCDLLDRESSRRQ
jgi:hypothetical protein